MVKQKLDEFAAAALDLLMRSLAALWVLAWLNRRMTAKGLVAAVAFLGARYGFEISPENQVALGAFLIFFLGLLGRDAQARRTLAVLALCAALTLAACPKVQTVRSVAAATVVACVEFKAEIAPDLTPEERAVIDPLVDEVGAAADGVRALTADWAKMGAAEQRELAAFAVEQIGGGVERLSNRGVGLKSERARAKFAKYLKWGRRAVSTLRVIEASLPPAER